jgi:hypothetical protein
MRIPPVKQNVELVLSFYSQEVDYLTCDERGILVKISVPLLAGLRREIRGMDIPVNQYHTISGCMLMRILRSLWTELVFMAEKYIMI